MPRLSGNKGEWSEAYVLLRLLGDGRIYAADENLNKIESIYFPIIKIIREEVEKIRHDYAVQEDGVIAIYVNDTLVKEMRQSDFTREADYLYERICQGGAHAFSVERTENFLHEIGSHKLTAPSSDKTDITMQIHDVQTGYNPICGFSIKSEVGSAPTLLNATGATNFIFKVKGISEERAEEINAIEGTNKIKDRMRAIFSESEVSFDRVNSATFEQNLGLIDTQFAEILSWALVYHYRDGVINCDDVVRMLEIYNPMGFRRTGMYTYKFKKFLCSIALGMKPAREWDGHDEANGGYIVVSAAGDVLAYHIYNRDFFEEYLLNNTKFERASTSRHGFASLYKENEDMFLKLNLQIRFK